mgnify:CR=1 FL=1
MKNNMIKLSFPEIIASIMIIAYGFNIFWRGLFLLKEQESILNDSPLYLALNHALPIWLWGMCIMIAGLFIISSAIYISVSKEKSRCSWLLLIGGTLTGILYFFMTSASIYNSISWLTTIHMSIKSGSGFIIAFVGGADLYARRK